MKQLTSLPFKNETGVVIPPGACLFVTDADYEAGEVILIVEKPTTSLISSGKPIAFNSSQQVPIGGGGICQLGVLALALGSGSIALGDEVGPVDGQWHLTTSGSGYKSWMADPSEAFPSARLVERLGGGGASNFYVYELTEDPVTGSPTTGAANIYAADDESTLVASEAPWVGNETIFDDQVTGDRGTCIEVSGTYYAVNAIGCDSGGGGSSGVYIGPTEPVDTSLLWIDTSGL